MELYFIRYGYFRESKWRSVGYVWRDGTKPTREIVRGG